MSITRMGPRNGTLVVERCWSRYWEGKWLEWMGNSISIEL